MATIELLIQPDGKTQVSVQGITGPACKTLTQRLETQLGEVLSCTPTAEMYEQLPPTGQKLEIKRSNSS